MTARLNDLQRCGAIRAQPIPLYETETMVRYCPVTKAAHTVYEVTGTPFKRMPVPTPIKEQLRRYKAFYEAYIVDDLVEMIAVEDEIEDIIE